MATDTRTIPTQSLSSDANFRSWGDAISKCLDAGGLNKSSDTGQINWSTVTRPAVNSWAGYEIWQLATDSKFSTLGLYIKLEYGIGNNSAYGAIAMTVGTSTDGAGTLTGTVGTRRAFGAGSFSTNAATSYTCSIDGTVIAMIAFEVGGTLYSYSFIIERLRDNSGAVTGDGIYTCFAGPVTGSGHNVYTEIIRSGSVTPNPIANRLGAFVSNASGNYLTDYYMATHHPADRHTLYNPCLANLFHYNGDLTNGVDVTISRYGTNRNYKPIGQLPSSGSFATAFGHSNAAIAILWE